MTLAERIAALDETGTWTVESTDDGSAIIASSKMGSTEVESDITDADLIAVLHTGICEGCEGEFDVRDHDSHCECCRRKNQAEAEKDELEATVERLAAERGWDIDSRHRAGTGSIYMTLSKECDSCILGGDEECECKTLKVRISDHGTAYCSEDVSLVIPSGNEGGDDHSIAALIRRLK